MPNSNDYIVDIWDESDVENNDEIITIIYKNGNIREKIFSIGFDYYDGDRSVWEYSEMRDHTSRDNGGKFLDKMLRIALEQLPCQFIITEDVNGDYIFYMRSSNGDVRSITRPKEDVFGFTAEELSRWVYLHQDFEDISVTAEYFEEKEEGYPAHTAAISYLKTSTYYRNRARYERRFSSLTDDPIREELADHFETLAEEANSRSKEFKNLVL